MSLSEWSLMGSSLDPPGETSQDEALEQLQWLLACLRAQYWSYQQSHWQVKNVGFYGNHRLYQELYEGVVGQVDTLAEKMVGSFGIEAVDGNDLGAKFVWWIRQWLELPGHHERGLRSESSLQSCCRRTYDLLKDRGTLTLGMDDFLMSLASAHETNTYLLQQALGFGPQEADRGWDALARNQG